jgi:hypothetical protein
MATTKKKTTRKPAKPTTSIGRYVIVRSDRAGVFAGILRSKQGQDVVLDDCRRLHYWKCKSGIALSGLSQHGIDSGSRVDSVTQGHEIATVIEVIPTTRVAEETIRAYR